MTTPHMPTQSADGRAHFTFYSHGVSFVWDGLAQHIEVSPGGYGEPVTAHAELVPFEWHLNGNPLARFRASCDQWLAHSVDGGLHNRIEEGS
jgi:hypothetical protein